MQRTFFETAICGLLCCLLAAFGGCTSASAPRDDAVDDTPRSTACTPIDGGVRTGTADGLTLRMIAPRRTDGCITMALDSHVVVRTTLVPAAGKLLVFLPGTGGVARNYQLMVVEAARHGYHAIGLTYPNSESVTSRCAGAALDCPARTRNEVLTGTDSTSVIAVDRVNSIEHRLIALLRFLRSDEASGGWGRYLSGDSTLVWEHISIAGHSQGGGFALFIAQRHVVWRASAYASYGDYLPSGAPSAWVTAPYRTPANRISGLMAREDELIPADSAFATWTRIGLAGPVTSADVEPVPVTARQFVTTRAPANRIVALTPYHNMVVLDVQTPLIGSTQRPALGAVWRQMSFPAVP